MDKNSEASKIIFPENLHGKIMSRFFFLRSKIPFCILTSLLSVNLAITGWHIWQRMSELETLSILRDIGSGFDWSSEFFEEFFSTIFAYAPIVSIAVFILNALLIGYVVFLFIKLREMK